jgi:coproporphyrinogen III oxidase
VRLIVLSARHQLSCRFGGGIDLTPYYPFPEQMTAFHDALAQLYLEHGVDYDEHKRTCDDYFVLPHRGETRGVGGVFFDFITLGRGSFADTLRFIVALGRLVPKLFQVRECVWCFVGVRNMLSCQPMSLNARRPFSHAMREFQLYRCASECFVC